MSLWDAITANLQMIGVIITIISLIIYIYFFYKYRKIKSFSYSVLTRAPLLTVAEELRGKIRVCYEERPNTYTTIKDGSLLIIKFVNDGNISIKMDEFEKPVNISFDPEVKILSAEIIETSPNNLKPNLVINSENNIVLEPLLLNERDSFTIKALLTGFDKNTKILPNARIAGILKINASELKKNYRNMIISHVQHVSKFTYITFILLFITFYFFSSPLQISVVPEQATASIGGETEASIFVKQKALVQVIDQIIGKDQISLDAYFTDRYEVPKDIDIIIQPNNFSSVPAMSKMKIHVGANAKAGIYKIPIRGVRGLETNGNFMFLEVVP